MSQKPQDFHSNPEEPHPDPESATIVDERVIDASTGTKKIPSLEAALRAICGSILGQPSRRTAQMNYVATTGDDEFAWLNATTNENQGNGEGPSAI